MPSGLTKWGRAYPIGGEKQKNKREGQPTNKKEKENKSMNGIFTKTQTKFPNKFPTKNHGIIFT